MQSAAVESVSSACPKAWDSLSLLIAGFGSVLSYDEPSAVLHPQEMSMPLDLTNREEMVKAASTSLNSKVISNNASLLAPLAVDAILSVIDPATATNVDLRDIAVVKKLGGTIDDTELVQGLVFTQKIAHSAGGPTRVKDAKIGLIQFCLSAPKTDIEQNVVVSDYSQMDRILKEERKYILDSKCCLQPHLHAGDRFTS